MDVARAFAISSAGLEVERLRVEVASVNLANAHTVADADGAVFQPSRVVARAGGVDAFARQVQRHLDTPVGTVEPASLAARRVHEPGHPLADARGFVAYAPVDPAAEMLTLMGATRAYEANVAALNAARTMAMKALDIGGTA